VASVHAAIIRYANEFGYFPTVAQAEEIIATSVRQYAQHYGGNPPRGRIDEQVYWSCMNSSIQQVMERRAEVREVIDEITDA
jgi:hypothetical protein